MVGAGVVGADERLRGCWVGAGETVGMPIGLEDGSEVGAGEIVGAVGSMLGDKLGNSVVMLGGFAAGGSDESDVGISVGEFESLVPSGTPVG